MSLLSHFRSPKKSSGFVVCFRSLIKASIMLSKKCIWKLCCTIVECSFCLSTARIFLAKNSVTSFPKLISHLWERTRFLFKDSALRSAAYDTFLMSLCNKLVTVIPKIGKLSCIAIVWSVLKNCRMNLLSSFVPVLTLTAKYLKKNLFWVQTIKKDMILMPKVIVFFRSAGYKKLSYWVAWEDRWSMSLSNCLLILSFSRLQFLNI